MKKTGPKLGDAAILAQKLWISKRAVLNIGLDRIAAMSAEALALFVGMSKETSRKMHDGIDEPSTAQIRARRREGRPARRRRAVSVDRMVELAGRAR